MLASDSWSPLPACSRYPPLAASRRLHPSNPTRRSGATRKPPRWPRWRPACRRQNRPGRDVSVYRWENGFVEGWVQFDGDGSPDRTPLDFLRRIVDQFLDQEAGRVPAAERLSGIAIVSRTKAHQAGSDDGGYDWYDCKVLIQATLASADRTSTSSVGVGAISGRLKVARREGQQVVFSDEVGGTVCRLRKPGMKSSDGPIWMELKVITPTDKTGA